MIPTPPTTTPIVVIDLTHETEEVVAVEETVATRIANLRKKILEKQELEKLKQFH